MAWHTSGTQGFRLTDSSFRVVRMLLFLGLAIFSKKRVAAGVVDSMILVGDVKGSSCLDALAHRPPAHVGCCVHSIVCALPSVGSLSGSALAAGKKCILVDDMCDTGGTLVKAAQQLKDAGATEVPTHWLRC